VETTQRVAAVVRGNLCLGVVRLFFPQIAGSFTSVLFTLRIRVSLSQIGILPLNLFFFGRVVSSLSWSCFHSRVSSSLSSLIFFAHFLPFPQVFLSARAPSCISSYLD
jgi:hypothetical protein